MRLVSALALTFVLACGPAVRENADDIEGDDAFDTPDAEDDCRDQNEVCSGGGDEDCDGFVDCADVDCFDIGECGNPGNCGELEELTGSLALPDGSGMAYTNSINFTGFSDGQTLVDTADLLGVCVNMEHSWLRDLQINLRCPGGQQIELQRFLGTTGSELFMGIPNDTDGVTPVPGTGWDYCWTPAAANLPMLDYANANPAVHDLPAGDYQAVSGFGTFVGCPLNGDWTIHVEDRWGIDNGFIFSWSVRFDPAIVENCDEWPVP